MSNLRKNLRVLLYNTDPSKARSVTLEKFYQNPSERGLLIDARAGKWQGAGQIQRIGRPRLAERDGEVWMVYDGTNSYHLGIVRRLRYPKPQPQGMVSPYRVGYSKQA